MFVPAAFRSADRCLLIDFIILATLRLKLGRCCLEFHYGTVLGTRSLLLLHIRMLRLFIYLFIYLFRKSGSKFVLQNSPTMQFDAFLTQSSAQPYNDQFPFQYITILRELELKMKAEILENMKRKGTAAPNLTESDIDLDLNYPSDIESRYVKKYKPFKFSYGKSH